MAGDILSTVLGATGDVGSLLSGIGSIFDLTGSGNNKDLAQQQLQMQQFLAQNALKKSTATQINARGDQLVYDQKTNTWKVIPSAATQALIKSSDAEQLARTQHDAPLIRAEQGRELAARGGASQAADAALTRYRDYNPLTPDELSSDLYTQAARGLKEGYGQTASDVSTQALRSGTGGGQLLDQLSRSYARDLGSARVDSRLKGLTTAGDINTANTNSLLTQYGNLRGVAAGVPNVTISPENLSGNLQSILNSRAGSAPGTALDAGNTSDRGYQNLLNQNTDYYKDLGMAGNDLLSGLSGLGQVFNDPTAATANQPTPTSANKYNPYGF